MPPLLRRSTRWYLPPIVSGTTAVAYGRRWVLTASICSRSRRRRPSLSIVLRVLRTRAWPWTRRPAACSPRMRGRRSTCRRSTARRWTASRARGGRARDAAGRRSGSPPARPAPRALERWRGDGDRHRRASCRTAPTPSSRSRMLSNVTTMWRFPIAVVARRRTFGRRAATCEPATWSSPPGRGSARRRSARSRRPASRASLPPARRAPPCSRPAPSCAARASRSRPAQIYEANGFILAAQLRAAGARGRAAAAGRGRRGGAPRPRSSAGSTRDVLVTTGGVSVGPHDLVRAAEAELGVEEVFWGVADQAGEADRVRRAATTLVFGLPGNPVSTLVGFELFVRPAAAGAAGRGRPLPRVRAGRSRPGRAERAPRRAACVPGSAVGRTDASCSSRCAGRSRT